MAMQLKKKILYIITKSNWGGAQKSVFDLATNLPRNVFEPAVLLGGSGELKDKLEGISMQTFAVPILVRDINFIKDIKSFFYILKVIKDFRPDVLHLHSPKAGGLGALAGRLCGVKKIIYTSHGWTFNENRPLWQRRIIKFFSWIIGILSTKIIVISNSEFEAVASWPLIRKKLTVIYNGIKMTTFLSTDESRKHLNLPQEALIIGSIGELTGNKNYTDLINVASQLWDKQKFILAIIGDGEKRAEITEKIKNDPVLNDHLKILGFKQDASRYLRAFDIFVLPSIKEGLPYVILEAGFAFLPVVATIVGGVPEIIESSKSGLLVQPKDNNGLKNAISFMLEHPKERAKYASALHASVTKKFSFEKMLAQTISLYNS